MHLKVCDFKILAESIQESNSQIILFGAGAIGQIVAPRILEQYGILKQIDCYLDNDSTKWNTQLQVMGRSVEIKSPEYLKSCSPDTVILINISRFAEVKEQLEQMECTQNMTAYIMPMMLIHNFCSSKSDGNPIMSDSPLIPKKIHYMWLGRKALPLALGKCIDSWKELCPDYEIIRWDEDNYDISKHPYMKQAYESGAYGFVPDFARLDILYREGGFYLDTDVVLKKSLEPLRYQDAFCGLEKWQIVNFGGGSGCVKGHPMVKKILDARNKLTFLDENGKQNRNTCGFYDTQVIIEAGFKINGETQNINGLNVYAYDYFQPYDYMSGILNETENTYSIHQFNGGWMDEHMKKQNEITAQNYLRLYNSILNS